MLRYIIFVIFGILLFLLLNRKDGFSIGISDLITDEDTSAKVKTIVNDMKKEVAQIGSYVTSLDRLDIGISLVESDFKQGFISKKEFKDLKKSMEESKKMIKKNHRKTFPAML